ncbi:MAG: histidine kinase, partial [Bacteroidales bacterium]|nr:histidine kinase [Bacteroidales bacterium]
EGIDESWHDAGQKTFVSYTNIAGGTYRFRLKANNNEEIVIPLYISTPFWKTWWFYGLIIMLLVFVSVMAHRLRLRQIRREEEIKSAFNKKISELEVKALRAQMNPHFLFNSLNSSRFYILKNQNENASDYITKFSKLLRLILKNSRQNQISLTDELHALEIYLEFEQMRFSKKFDFDIKIAETVNTDKIQVQPMTIQPFVENAIWHGLMPKENDRLLRIAVKKNEKYLNIVIEDNGIGREEAAKIRKDELSETKSYGLQITEDRMNIMNRIGGKESEFKIIDLYDEEKNPCGTRVLITYEL